MVKELVRIAPHMVLIPDSRGNYPIHLAIHYQQSYDTIKTLFEALPATMLMWDLKTKLLPFMLAAVGDWENENNQMTIIYELLKEDPHSIFP